MIDKPIPDVFSGNKEQASIKSEHTNYTSSIDWLYITNQMNLMMILAAGLFMPQQGFGDKYYRDLLQLFPDWIPLFPESVQQDLVEQVISEAHHLKPTIAQLDISQLNGQAKAVKISLALRDIELPGGLDENDVMILVPAPLPTSLIQEIYFPSFEGKKNFILQAKSNYKNVPVNWFKTGTRKKLFNGPRSVGDINSIKAPAQPEIFINRSQAVGAILTMFFHLANRSEYACHYYQWIFEKGDASGFDPILQQLPAWLNNSHIDEGVGIQVRLFWTIVEHIITAPIPESRDVVIDVLDREISLLSDSDKGKNQLKLLKDDLQGIRGLSDDTRSSLFEKHAKPFSRSLILFFLYNDCRELLEFDHSSLNDTDYIVAAILFGAREGWINLANDLRHSQEFSENIAYHMAAQCHRSAETGLKLKQPPKRVIPIRELLDKEDNNKRLQKKRADATLEITRQMNWDCIETTILLEKGEYRLIVDQRGTRLILDGDLKRVYAKVDQEKFFDFFAELPLPLLEEVEKMARKIVV
ncbi:MAG: hypothetical protein LWX01_09700 [Deltaproteobacteria bacterium]|nr:hypothetical protein [Deltaproteobacteria bacterium]MDL1961950.1 hypothetical protein [Deltaproteobacteria bacterium]